MVCPRAQHIVGAYVIVAERFICGLKEAKRKSCKKEEVVHGVKSSKGSRKIRTKVSVGCGNMEATGDLRGDSSRGSRSPSQQTHQVPPLRQSHLPRAEANLSGLPQRRSKTRGQILSRRLVREGEEGMRKRGGEGLRKDYSRMTGVGDVPEAARAPGCRRKVPSGQEEEEGCVLL